MKTIQELLAELLQLCQEHQKNITKLSEHHERLEHYLSTRKKKESFKSKVIGDMDASSHEGSLTDDFLEVHASTHEVCNEVDKTSASNISLELSYEVENTSTCDGDIESTYDDYDDYDGLCVKLSLSHSSSSTTKTQLSMAAITREDVSGT